MELFTSADFKIFDIREFNERMGSIILKIRPKLASIGEADLYNARSSVAVKV
jgi:uncharacterized protein YktB (UPF0637 family)